MGLVVANIMIRSQYKPATNLKILWKALYLVVALKDMR